jgi:hypothetical protein
VPFFDTQIQELARFALPMSVRVSHSQDGLHDVEIMVVLHLLTSAIQPVGFKLLSAMKK